MTKKKHNKKYMRTMLIPIIYLKIDSVYLEVTKTGTNWYTN